MDISVLLTVAKVVTFTILAMTAIALGRHMLLRLSTNSGLQPNSKNADWLSRFMIVSSLLLCFATGAEITLGMFQPGDNLPPDMLAFKLGMLVSLVAVVVVIHTAIRPWLMDSEGGDLAERLSLLRSFAVSFSMALLLAILSVWPVATFHSAIGLGMALLNGTAIVLGVLFSLFMLALLVLRFFTLYEFSSQAEPEWQDELPPGRQNDRRNNYN